MNENKPFKLSGKDFEKVILDQAARYEKAKLLTLGRYGVSGAMIGGQWTPIPSYPDFEGVAANGRQIILEAKTTSQKSLPLNEKSIKPRQVMHMEKRRRFGALCGILCFHHGRELKSGAVESRLMLYPVDRGIPWVDTYISHQANKRGHAGSIEPEAGFEIEWVKAPRARIHGPDLIQVIEILSTGHDPKAQV